MNTCIECKKDTHCTIWSPTWFDAYEGPIKVCYIHARRFQIEHNCYASGLFFWEEKATQAFNKVTFLLPSQPQYQTTYTTLFNFGVNVRKSHQFDQPHLFKSTSIQRECKPAEDTTSHIPIYQHKGNFWMMHWKFLANLGNHDQFNELFRLLVM